MLGPVPVERRLRVRFPLKLPVNFRILGRQRSSTGVGWVVNISSGGVLVQCPHHVPMGARLELKIEIPQRLEGVVPLQIFVLGRVVRCEESRFAVAMIRYQYRTMGSTIGSFEAPCDGVAKQKKPPAKAAGA
jgi:hypothetical protein